MPIKFSDSFWSENGLDLKKPDIACLRQDGDLYKTMLLQPNIDLYYDDTKLWFESPDQGDLKLRDFWKTVFIESPDLVLIPEYCHCWDLLEELVINNTLPGQHQLWVCGSQSINAVELLERTRRRTEVTWIYDEELVKENIAHPEKFFDPACIIFKTRDNGANIRTVVIIQFKTKYFGGKGFEWERDHMIPGKKVYLVSNENEAINLVVLICSDTLNNELKITRIPHYLNIPFLFVHIQLNQSPNKDLYKNYRNVIYGASFVDKEVICLNWSRNTKMQGKIWNDYGGSTLYSKSKDMDMSDNRINHNHLKGLYYNRWANRYSDLYQFNFDEHIFLFTTTKSSQLSDSPTQQKRTGPKSVKTWTWKGSKWNDANEVNDGFKEFCTPIEAEFGSLKCLSNNLNKIDVERLLRISTVEDDLEADWYLARSLKYLQIEDQEINQRMCFTHQPEESTRTIRHTIIVRYAILKHVILKNKIKPLPKYYQKPVLRFNPAIEESHRYLVNLSCNQTKNEGTIIFLGPTTTGRAIGIKNKVTSLFKNTHRGKRVMVYYYNPKGVLDSETNEGKPEIVENLTKNPFSITRTRR